MESYRVEMQNIIDPPDENVEPVSISVVLKNISAANPEEARQAAVSIVQAHAVDVSKYFTALSSDDEFDDEEDDEDDDLDEEEEDEDWDEDEDEDEDYD